MTHNGPWNPNDNTYHVIEDRILDYQGIMVENKDILMMIMSDIDVNERLEVVEVVSETESSLVEKIFYEADSECRSIDGNFGYSLQDNSCTSRFKMLTCSTNDLLTPRARSIWMMHQLSLKLEKLLLMLQILEVTLLRKEIIYE